MKEQIKKPLNELFTALKFALKFALVKLKNPRSGYYTLLVLTNGFSMDEIDEWVADTLCLDIHEGSIHELREACCEIEVSYWEE